MAMNMIQFQKGLSILEFNTIYENQEKCEEVIAQMRWPEGYKCFCGSNEHYSYRRGKQKIYQCCRCKSQTSLTAGTIFEQTKLPLKSWLLAIYFITQSKNSVSALELKRLLGNCYRTAWRLRHKLLQVMLEREQDRTLSGRIEMDDAYLGGENQGGKAGRGSENKVPFIAAVETNTKGYPVKVVFSKVLAFNSFEIEKWAKAHLKLDSLIKSDGYRCFNALARMGFDHAPEVVGTKQKSTSMDCFKWVNTILGNLKTSQSGTFHSFNFVKYAQRYLSEVQYRFNRRFDLRSMVIRLVKACVNTSARPENWLRLSEG